MTTLNFNYSEYNPKFTFKAKDPLSALSHFIGFLCSIVLSPVLLIHLSNKGASHIEMISLGIFMLSMILLYGASASYHSFNISEKANRVLKKLDHMSIFILIAGSYTPILLVPMRAKYPVLAWSLFGLVWGCAIIACTLTAIDLKKYSVFSMICYLAMGWVIIIFIKPTIEVMGTGGVILLVAGGIAYTVGSILYGLGSSHKWMHSIFHLFILAGSILHFFAIILYAL